MGYIKSVARVKCDLFIKSEAIPRIPDTRMELHFNNLLDILSDWRAVIKDDIPLSEAIQMAHKVNTILILYIIHVVSYETGIKI